MLELNESVAKLTFGELKAMIQVEVEQVVYKAMSKPLPPPPIPEHIRRQPLNFPVDDYGPWPEGLSLRREDMYDDDGR